MNIRGLKWAGRNFDISRTIVKNGFAESEAAKNVQTENLLVERKTLKRATKSKSKNKENVIKI